MPNVNIAGSSIPVGTTIAFSYVCGNDRPYIQRNLGTFEGIMKTNNYKELVKLNTGSFTNYYWMGLIIEGSVEVIK